MTRIRCEGLRYECFTTETVDTALESEQKSLSHFLGDRWTIIFVVTQKSIKIILQKHFFAFLTEKSIGSINV